MAGITRIKSKQKLHVTGLGSRTEVRTAYAIRWFFNNDVYIVITIIPLAPYRHSCQTIIVVQTRPSPYDICMVRHSLTGEIVFKEHGAWLPKRFVALRIMTERKYLQNPHFRPILVIECHHIWTCYTHTVKQCTLKSSKWLTS